MNLDIASTVAGALFGFGIGTVFGVTVGLILYGRVTKDTFARLRATLTLKK